MSLGASQIVPLPGYPQQWGTKNITIAEVVGPKSYATGGQLIQALPFGWGGFDRFSTLGLSYSGTYSFQIVIQPANPNPSTQNQGVKSYKVKWIVVSTGLEVANTTDLSGEIFRCEASST